MYATVGLNDEGVDPGAVGVGEDSDLEDQKQETGAAGTSHPYAKVKKKDHPYATVKKPLPGPPIPAESSPAPDPVSFNPEPVAGGASAHGEFFSGDSQDSSKGYTSISVRQPLSHIQRALQDETTTPLPNYVAVSEASDEMYAAIEDPSYIPTGASQSNSDTYAVINLPEEEEDVVDGAAASTAPVHHHYSKIDKSKKRKAPLAPPQLRPHSLVPQPPIPILTEARRSLNVEEMYAKVLKDDHRVPPPHLYQYDPILPQPSEPKPCQYDGYELVSRNQDPGYETVTDEGARSGPKDPPYAVVQEDEEGYETIPADPGYEMVTKADPGYEIVRGNSDFYSDPVDFVTPTSTVIDDEPAPTLARQSSVVVIEGMGTSISMVANPSNELPGDLSITDRDVTTAHVYV